MFGTDLKKIKEAFRVYQQSQQETGIEDIEKRLEALELLVKQLAEGFGS